MPRGHEALRLAPRNVAASTGEPGHRRDRRRKSRASGLPLSDDCFRPPAASCRAIALATTGCTYSSASEASIEGNATTARPVLADACVGNRPEETRLSMPSPYRRRLSLSRSSVDEPNPFHHNRRPTELELRRELRGDEGQR
jgi:hypothetical protein